MNIFDKDFKEILGSQVVSIIGGIIAGIFLTEKVNKIINLKKKVDSLKDKQTDQKAQLEKEIQKLDNEIDEEVYKLYGITEEEKKVIEDSLK